MIPASSVLGTPPEKYDQKYWQNVIGCLNRAFRRYDANFSSSSSNTVLNGSGAPTSSVGSNGDFYIDTVAEFIYGPKASGVWPAGVSITGPAGEDGADGTPGTPGSPGPAGPAGSTAILNVSANYTALTSDCTILVNAAVGGVTITLPLAPTTGQPVNVKKIDSTSNAVTVNGNGKNIDGSASISTIMPSTDFAMQYDGSAWWLL